MLMEDRINGALICRTSILQAKGHYCVAVSSQMRPENVCFSSSGYILIWLYPENPSMKDIRSNLQVLSIMTSVIERGNSSFGQASFRSRKSMQTRVFPFFGNGDDISYPIAVLFLPDKARVYELFDFRLNCFHYFWTESLLLFDWLHVWINVKAMHSHSRQAQACPRNSKRKHLYTLAQEILSLLTRRVISFLL